MLYTPMMHYRFVGEGQPQARPDDSIRTGVCPYIYSFPSQNITKKLTFASGHRHQIKKYPMKRITSFITLTFLLTIMQGCGLMKMLKIIQSGAVHDKHFRHVILIPWSVSHRPA